MDYSNLRWQIIFMKKSFFDQVSWLPFCSLKPDFVMNYCFNLLRTFCPKLQVQTGQLASRQNYFLCALSTDLSDTVEFIRCIFSGGQAQCIFHIFSFIFLASFALIYLILSVTRYNGASAHSEPIFPYKSCVTIFATSHAHAEFIVIMHLVDRWARM